MLSERGLQLTRLHRRHLGDGLGQDRGDGSGHLGCRRWSAATVGVLGQWIRTTAGVSMGSINSTVMVSLLLSWPVARVVRLGMESRFLHKWGSWSGRFANTGRAADFRDGTQARWLIALPSRSGERVAAIARKSHA